MTIQDVAAAAGVSVEPGQTKTVTFELFTHQFGFYNREMRYVVEPGTLEIVGETAEISRDQKFFSQVTVHETPLS